MAAGTAGGDRTEAGTPAGAVMTGGLDRAFGLILAGGQGRRLGGREKCLLRVGGVPILDRILAILSPACVGVVLNVNGDPGRFCSYGLPIVGDAFEGHQGPLAGLHAGLSWISAQSPETPLVASVAADTPFLPIDLVERLVQGRSRARAVIAQAASSAGPHPTTALWPAALSGDAATALTQGRRGLGTFAARYALATVAWPDAPYDPFMNVNTAADLARAEAFAAGRS